MKKSTINRRNIEAKILLTLSKSSQPLSTADIATKLHKSWHTIIRHCLNLELERKLTKFTAGRLSLWMMKKRSMQ